MCMYIYMYLIGFDQAQHHILGVSITFVDVRVIYFDLHQLWDNSDVQQRIKEDR